MSNASTPLAIAASAAVATFVVLFFGLPAAELSPGPTDIYVFSGLGALISAGFVITGENFFEHIVKSVLLGAMGLGLWLLPPREGHWLATAIVACTVGTCLSLIERRLERRPAG